MLLIKLVQRRQKRKIRFASARHKWWCARHKQKSRGEERRGERPLRLRCTIGWMELGDLDWSRAEQSRASKAAACAPPGRRGR